MKKLWSGWVIRVGRLSGEPAASGSWLLLDPFDWSTSFIFELGDRIRFRRHSSMTVPLEAAPFLGRPLTTAVYMHFKLKCAHCWHCCSPLQRTFLRLQALQALLVRFC